MNIHLLAWSFPSSGEEQTLNIPVWGGNAETERHGTGGLQEPEPGDWEGRPEKGGRAEGEQ